ncbi:ABC transporter, substrate binding protein, PQQ-dependent alcohol dehydrogenase system [Methylomagnum ishizawai]|uniref:ABC transporter, substrate binding protein, PQQ-dependent alcohol dehydrogenase system n=1 Tax=Methylomagnum ishizawai TaxID=1760988 RepID=A0A1Y6D0L8_9GAMM|nr:ABC transporter substrate-binding protein [Methylomagnum ishizawai]SMF96187.1 ABC transporter, substrate binding protein, PQQ-dependent alcohol dehydrogenase system [Methylomagnum ishizawai]
MTPKSSILLSLLLAAALPVHAAHKPSKPAPRPETPPAAAPAVKADTLTLAYLTRQDANPPTVPFFDPVIIDSGLQGARLGIQDDNTTGRFTRQNFVLKETILPPEGDVVAAFKALAAEGHRHFLLDLPAPLLLELAALPEAQNALLYDTASRDDALRAESCRANLLHLLPSRAMRADALAQYLAKKRWQKWFLAIGPNEGDRLYAAAVRSSAKKFGAKIVAEKPWEHSFDERRSPESEVPVFTQGVDYEVLIVADESGLFGDYLPYRTWQPRPVAGTQGLVPTAWHHTHEAWGALQLQNRFRAQAGRWMAEADYGAWLAVRAIGEAATRAKSVEFEPVKAFMLGEQFALAGFKGVPLSFRSWDRQLRQPVLLAAERSLVAVAPIEGYLHPRNELDSLGIDQAESKCKF